MKVQSVRSSAYLGKHAPQEICLTAARISSHTFWLSFLRSKQTTDTPAFDDMSCSGHRRRRHKLHGRTTSGWLPAPFCNAIAAYAETTNSFAQARHGLQWAGRLPDPLDGWWLWLTYPLLVSAGFSWTKTVKLSTRNFFWSRDNA